MHFANVVYRRHLAGADRPDWLVGDRKSRRVVDRSGQRSIKLGRYSFDRTPGLSHRITFSDAQNDVQAGGERGFGLGPDLGVGFAPALTPLAMPDNRQP